MRSIKTMCNTQKQSNFNSEICNECGRNVWVRSGLFVDRVVDLDNYKTRKKTNKPYPQRSYICRECE